MSDLAMTPPAWHTCPTYTLTLGPEVVDLAASVGLVLDEAQAQLVDDWFSIRPGTAEAWNVAEGAIVVARQNLKTVTLEAAVLAKLFLFEDELITWSAHLYSTSQEAFRDVKAYVDNFDDLRREVKTVSIAKGDESIELMTGQRLKFQARTSHGGRGLSGDCVVLDEALKLTPAHVAALVPSLSARRGAQLLYGSSAGDAPAAVLRTLRDRGRAGAPRLAYTEYAAPEVECGQDGCVHLAGTPGCALDREDLLRAANPALAFPDRLQLEFIQLTERNAIPPAEFARERLGWWDDPPLGEMAAFAPGSWEACADPKSEISGAVTLAASMTPDRSTVSLVAAGRRPDGELHVEVVSHGPGGAAFVSHAAAVATRQHTTIVVVPGHAIGGVLPELQAAGVDLRMISGAEYTQACGAFFDAITGGAAHYRPPQPELDDAIRRAFRKPHGDAWRWAGDRISALVAASQALYVASTVPEDEGGWMVFL